MVGVPENVSIAVELPAVGVAAKLIPELAIK
jgi:hypothetical protein